ncbi:protein-glutamine gamma-glutamyltransferase K [Aplysia californica]|uniref:Protein-glutamine gamma-glutamyltransferase K n=1 Tax=Aplysia californica TaxID=6500 RepID=A0ABM1A992_APLCA|nr:protein-glutamine gamma-glutamyltransferase K [Aplysia californica]
MARTRRPRSSGGTSSSSRAPKLRRHRYFTRSRSKRLAMLGGEQEGRLNTISDEEHRNRINLLKPTSEAPSKALAVGSLDLNKVKNGRDHHTGEYEVLDLVVRRGQPFTATVTFDRDVDKENDSVVVQFAFGSKPQESKATLLRLRLDIKDIGQSVNSTMGKWSAQVKQIEGADLTFSVTPPPNALVGKYGVYLETSLKEDDSSLRRFEMEDDEVFVIFNPWCKDDLVYMEESDERFEYVLNDRGRIWVGSAFNHCGRPWNFGQFDNPVLEAALLLMDKGEVGDTARRSPVSFVRTISALANSCDDNGVLEGRWTEKYPKDCTLPWSWTGSVKILKEFMDSGKPVKFGQCWVFSGLVTSLLRSLGIPTRSVTNFESAHDTDCSMTIDSHFDEDDEPVTWMDDSVWNFHVWNESFFRRLDLPKGYDGWQAHDATPQELSEGVMRCGPASMRAIMEGHVYLNYDVPFIFSEVNGDRVNWKVLANGEMKVINIDTHSVGKFISTKSVGSNFRNDLTLAYKYPENSEEERKVVEFVHNYSSRAEYEIYDKEDQDVTFELVIPHAASLGENFEVVARVKNISNEKRSVYGRLTVLSSFYTGIPGKRVKGQQFTVDVNPNEESDLILEVTKSDYLSKLNPEASLKAYASLHVTETEQQFAQTQAFTLVKPFLDITVPDVIKAKEVCTGTVTFTNPLDHNLTSGVINLEGASVMSADTFSISKPIKPNETVTYDFKICPRRAGNREVEATFTSDQLSGVDGSVEFNVQAVEED